MTRHVLPNSHMVAHVWAARTQDSGRTSNGTISFERDDLYSYRALIARFVQDINGNTVALISRNRWSITTSKHQSLACGAIPDSIPHYRVSSLHDHAENVAAYVAAYQESLVRARRARDWHGGGDIADHAAMVRDYAAAFGVAMPSIDTDADIAAVVAFREAREARLNTPANRVKREHGKAQRAALAARIYEAALRENSEAIAAWRRGEHLSLPWAAAQATGVLLRIKGSMLETSRGVKVPLSHAVRVFRRVQAVRDAGISWQRNGETMRVGQFYVDRIEADGTIHAGCHVIRWPEIAAAAHIAGVFAG